MGDAAASAKPCLLAKFVHVKSPDEGANGGGVIECRRTTSGGRKRGSSYQYEMNVPNYEMEYVGEPDDDGYCRGYEWVAAVRNRTTGKTVFVPYDVVRFRPKIRMSEEERNRTTKIDSSNYEEIRTRLIMEFGHKKQKQMLTSSLRNAVDEKATGHLFSDAMKHMANTEDSKRDNLNDSMAGSEKSAASPYSPNVQLSSALPPCNLYAKVPSEIYNIADIVPDEILEVLKLDAENYLLLTPIEAKLEGHPCLVMAVIQMTSSTKDVEERTKRVAYCLYLSYLIRLNTLIGGRNRFISPNALSQTCSMPQTVLQDLLSKYTSAGANAAQSEQQRRSWSSVSKLAVSSLHKDALLANVSVLLLILSGQYAFNINKAAKDLGLSEGKVSLSKLTAITRALGCRLEKQPQSGDQICVLEQPPKQKNALLGKKALGGRRR